MALICVMCSLTANSKNTTFLTGSMKNHDKSKKHREMVALLRQQLEEEEESLTSNSGENRRKEVVEEEEEEDIPQQKWGSFALGLLGLI